MPITFCVASISKIAMLVTFCVATNSKRAMLVTYCVASTQKELWLSPSEWLPSKKSYACQLLCGFHLKKSYACHLLCGLLFTLKMEAVYSEYSCGVSARLCWTVCHYTLGDSNFSICYLPNRLSGWRIIKMKWTCYRQTCRIWRTSATHCPTDVGSGCSLNLSITSRNKVAITLLYPRCC
jgi:hypothetical protein